MVTRTAVCIGIGVGVWAGACGGQKSDGAGALADRSQRSESSYSDKIEDQSGGGREFEGPAANHPSVGGTIGRGGEQPFAAATAGTSLSVPASGGQGGAPAPSPPSNATKYAGRGFVVHEWGTNTVVSGSDGALQIGLHHEEEDLPPFVYDRLKAAVAKPNLDPIQGNVHVKMETPVLYFYSDRALTVHAAVRFPRGVLTQWYPGVAWFKPPIVWSGANNPSGEPPKDPAFDAVVQTSHCDETYRKNGVLDWGAFEVLPPGSEPAGLPDAPLAQYTWSYARDVASNLLRFPDSEKERFLFYRGLANLELPAQTRSLGGGQLSLTNLGAAPLGPAFVIEVRGDSGAFRAYPEGVPAGATLAASAPPSGSFAPLPEYTAALAEAVTRALSAQGLYTDESAAMVNTWKRQWFGTPGLRVLYLAPQSWTEEHLPLTLDPLPEALLRVMMVRVEVLTPELEAADVEALALMERDAAAGRAHFAAAGRFAEPRLRRALALAPSAAGEAYLSELATSFSRSGGLSE